MAPPKSDWDKQMSTSRPRSGASRLSSTCFSPAACRVPRETRARVAALVKKHDQSFIRNTADRFRFESLQNRYQKFIELWNGR